MSYFRKTVIQGTKDDGSIANIPATSEGHLEVEIHGPRNPFGSLHVESLLPVVQGDAVHGINTGVHRTTVSGSGDVTVTNGLFVVSTGTTQYSFGTIQSKKRARYRPGQGIMARFTALWSTPVANSIVVAGVGHAESGFYFGFNGTTFGILHSTGGIREIRTLTVTTKSSNAENITITLNNANFTVAVTNGTNTAKTAYEISLGTFSGWTAIQRDSTVVFVSNDIGSKNGTYGLSGATSAVGSFVRSTAGVASTDTWIAQSDWNGDKLDGTGASGVTLDKTKGNVFQIDIQYLGFGSITFKIEIAPVSGNNPDFVTVHTINIPNSRTTPSLSNPSFPFTAAAYSAGSTTNVSVSVASFAIFVEGKRQMTGNRFTYSGQITTATSTQFTPLFTIRNDIEFRGRASQAVMELISISGAVKHTQPVSFYIIKNGTLGGNPNFVMFSSSSCSYIDTSATSVTISDNSQMQFSCHLGETGGFTFAFAEELSIQPDETLTLAAKTSAGTAAYTLGTLNTREDI